MTLLGIVVAVQEEARCLVKRRKVKSWGALIRLREGTLLNLSGMGAELSCLAAETLLKNGATALLSWGSASGLHPGVSAGSLILPETILLPDQTTFSVHETWHKRLSRKLRGYVDLNTGPLIQVPAILKSTEEKSALFQKTRAIAADMESASVAEVAVREGIPFMVIRAISDPSNMTIPRSALAAVDKFGMLHLSHLLNTLARHPQEIFSLICLARNFQAAQATLRKVISLTGHKFLVQ